MIYFLIFFACFSEFQSLQTNISYYQPIGWPFVLAHRGASGYLPESTLEAFEVAIYGKTDFVEMDVVLTKDKQLLVMHDPYLSRVTNIEDFPEFFDRKSTRIIDNKSISDYFTDNFTLQELKQLSIRQGLIDERPKIFDYKFKAPSLDEFLKFMIDRNQKIKENYPQQKLIGVFLEAKNGNMYKEIYGSDFEIGELLLKKLDEFGLADANNATMYCPIVLQSFPIETTKYFEESGNKLPRIQLLHHESYNYDLEEVNRYAHGVGVSFPMILTVNSPTEIRKNDYIKNAHKLGLKVFPYTFQDDNLAFGRNSEEIYTLAKDYLEADGIFTEFFDVAITVYKTLNSQKN